MISFCLLTISSATFLLLAYDRSNYLIYISRSLFSFSTKLLSFSEVFFSLLIYVYNWIKPDFMVSLSFSSSVFSFYIAVILSYTADAALYKLSCFSSYLCNKTSISWSYFSFTFFKAVKLCIIYLISSNFFD